MGFFVCRKGVFFLWKNHFSREFTQKMAFCTIYTEGSSKISETYFFLKKINGNEFMHKSERLPLFNPDIFAA